MLGGVPSATSPPWPPRRSKGAWKWIPPGGQGVILELGKPYQQLEKDSGQSKPVSAPGSGHFGPGFLCRAFQPLAPIGSCPSPPDVPGNALCLYGGFVCHALAQHRIRPRQQVYSQLRKSLFQTCRGIDLHTRQQTPGSSGFFGSLPIQSGMAWNKVGSASNACGGACCKRLRISAPGLNAARVLSSSCPIVSGSAHSMVARTSCWFFPSPLMDRAVTNAL